MFKRLCVLAASMVLVGAVSASAQPKAEVSAIFGWVFSDGVSGNSIRALDGNIYDRVDPKDSGSFGFDVGVHVGEHAEVGFLYGYQFSKLVFGGTADREVGDLGVTTYHGYFGYNFGERDAKMVPFVFGGLGATNFGSVDYAVAGRVGTTGSETQFSTTWGGGVKVFPSPRVGVRIAGRWTPTYIKSDSAGWWCDPYWGCYLVGNAQYSNQVELSGGVIFRF